MSKRKEKTRTNPGLGDWNVAFARTAGGCVIGQSWFTRDKRGGYTFNNETGVAYDFPPGSVAYVRRVPEPEHAELFEVTPHGGGFKASCKCGRAFVGTSAENARDLVAGHVSGTDDD